MKTKIIATMILAVIIGMANAQDKNYWVVETSAQGKSIVKIYDTNNKLVREANVARRIDITKKKERKMLNKMATRAAGDLLWSKR